MVSFPPEEKAEVAELVDALGLGSSVLGRAGSIPVLGIFSQISSPFGEFFRFWINLISIAVT